MYLYIMYLLDRKGETTCTPLSVDTFCHNIHNEMIDPLWILIVWYRDGR